jgi:hypothetical protein
MCILIPEAMELTPPPSSGRTWFGVSVLYAALTLLYAWPLLAALGSRLPGDTGDAGLNSWILWWNAQALPLTERWWNAPAFYPAHGAFAFSETLLGIAPLTSCVQWFGASAVQAHNIAYLFSFFSAALSAHALARRLTGSHAAALVAGVGFGFNPYRAAQVFHIQLLMSFWMPLGLLGLHRFLEHRRHRDLALFAVCWLMNGLTSGYFLFFFAVFVTLWIVWFVRTWRDAFAIVGAAAMASFVLAPWLAGYSQRQAAFGFARGRGDAEFFGADLSAIWASSPFVWLPSHWTFAPRAEGELYPGVVILVLAIVGGWLAWRGRDAEPATVGNVSTSGRTRLRRVLLAAGTVVALIAIGSWLWGGWQLSVAGVSLSTNRPYKTVSTAIWLFLAAALMHPGLADGWRRRSTLLFYSLAALVMFVFALGPLARAFGWRFLYAAPYAWLMALPGGHALRVPARFATLIGLCLAQAAALAFVRLTRGRPRAPVVATLAVAIALDGWVPKLKTEPVPAPVDLAGLDGGAAVLELPNADLYADTGAMLRATRYGRPIVNGFSGYEPPHYAFLRQAVQAKDATAFEALGRFGPLLLVVDRVHDEGGANRDFVVSLPGARVVRELPAATVFSLPARPPPPDVSEATSGRSPANREAPIPIRSITGVETNTPVVALTDSNEATAWTGRSAAGTEASLRVTLQQTATISKLELDLGPEALSYPKRVRVRFSGAEGDGTAVIWEGGTAGPAILAALRNPTHIPMALDLPVRSPIDQFIVTFDNDQRANWKVTELRVYGKQ